VYPDQNSTGCCPPPHTRTPSWAAWAPVLPRAQDCWWGSRHFPAKANGLVKNNGHLFPRAKGSHLHSMEHMGQLRTLVMSLSL
jgi:hypothetical protein